jgi:hypothetical protein
MNSGALDRFAVTPVLALMEIVRAGVPSTLSEAPKLHRASECTTAHWFEWAVSIALPSFRDSARACSTGTRAAAATCKAMSTGVVPSRSIFDFEEVRAMVLVYSAGSFIGFPRPLNRPGGV